MFNLTNEKVVNFSKFGFILSFIFFAILFYFLDGDGIGIVLVSLIFSSLIFIFSLMIGFLFLDEKERGFKLLSFKGLNYVFGFSGFMIPLFWLILYLIHLSDKKINFINSNFHRRVYYFGCFVTLMILIMLIFTLFFAIIGLLLM